MSTAAGRRRIIGATRGQRRSALGAMPLLALSAAAGLILVALGNTASREGLASAQPLFWGGLVVIYAPIALRLLSTSASREERLALSVLLGVALYLVKILYSPTAFTLHDELATWRQTSDFLETGHPLSPNSLVTGYAGFPGLEAISAALSNLSGLAIFPSGTIVIGIARLLLMLGLFLFFERATGSPRAAGIGIAIYVCNPSFYYFDSQFAYESLALVIAAAILLVALQWTERNVAPGGWNWPGMAVATALFAATLAVTHHMTSYVLTLFLAAWTAIAAIAAKRIRWGTGPLIATLMVGGAAFLWFFLEARQVTTSELGSVFEQTIESVVHLITGESGSKTLFQSAGQTNTTAARILGVASIVPLLAVIPLGLWRTWRGREENPLWRALALVALLYPAALLLRLTQAGTETSQRASEFVFVGLAFICGLLISERTWRGSRASEAAKAGGATALLTVIFVGGLIIGESPATRQPGSFVVGGESRSITPQGGSAAAFAAHKLPVGSRVIVDRPNSTLLASYGRLERVTGSIGGISVWRVFFTRRFDEIDQRVISNDAIDYIVVDRRLSHETPLGGYYFDRSESGANKYLRPISAVSLRKFNDTGGLSRIFDNGAIAIYDTSGLRE